MVNTVLKHPNLHIENLVTSSDNLTLEIRLLNGLNALQSTLVTLYVSRNHDNTYSGYLFVEPTGIPGIEDIADGELYQVPKGVIPHDEEHRGLIYRQDWPDTLPGDITDEDRAKYDYIDYEGAEDSLAGFFDYPQDDYPPPFDCLAAQVNVLIDWANSKTQS